MADRPISDIQGKALRGGAITVRDKASIPAGSFSMVQNFRPKHPGFVKRDGHRKLNLTAVSGTGEVKTINQFHKKRVDDYYTFAQVDDNLIQFTYDPPLVISGTLGTTVHSGSGTTIAASYADLKDLMIYSNGVDQHQIYGGNNSFVNNFIVYKGTSFPRVPDSGEDFSVEVGDNNTSTYAELDSLSTRANFDCIFIRTPVKVSGFNFTIGNANATAAVLQAHYWNGSWTALTGLTDGTSTGGATMAKTGTVSFTEPTDMISKYQFGRCGYWYQLSLSSGALDSDTTVTAVTFNSNFSSIENIWDGSPIYCTEVHTYDASESNNGTYATHGAAYVDVSSLGAAGDRIYVAVTDPIEGLYIDVGTVPNTNSGISIDACYYWNGDSWTGVSGLNDGTNGLTESGWLLFDRQSNVEPRQFRNTQYFTYWYYFTLSGAVSEDTNFSIEFMPYFDVDELGKSRTVISWKNRAVYTFTKYGEYLYISSSSNPLVLNGLDYGIIAVGDGRANKVVNSKKFYNELMVWQEEKGEEGGCVTLIEGYSPSTFGSLLLSNEVGTMNSKSVAVVDGVYISTQDNNAPKFDNSTVAYFLSRKGVFMTDGRSVSAVSDDIQNYFMPSEPECIRRGYEDKMYLTYDSSYNVLLVGLVSGDSATNVNVELVYDLVDHCWYFDDRGQKLACVKEVAAKSGDYNVIQIGGGIDDGTVYHINYGDNDYGTPIDSYVHMEINGKGEILELKELLLKAKAETGGNMYVEFHDAGRRRSERTIPLIPSTWDQDIKRYRRTYSFISQHIGIRVGNNEPQKDFYLMDIGLQLDAKEGW